MVGIGDLRLNLGSVLGKYRKMLQPQVVAPHPRSDEFDHVPGLDPVAHTDQKSSVAPHLIDDADEIMTADVGRLVLLPDVARLAEQEAGSKAAMAQLGQFVQPFGAAAPPRRIGQVFVKSLAIDSQ